MALDAKLVREHLREFDLKGLFNELGWDQFSYLLPINVNDEPFDLKGVAEKRGVQIFECQTDTLPDYATRKKIEQKVKDYAFEHLIVFTDSAKTTQIWQWVARQTGQRTAYREHTYHKGYADEALLQKLNGIVFYLSEEEEITLDEVNKRLKDEFDKDKLTKQFYDKFKKEHDAFLEFVQGIQAQGDREWYASVMLNRLMFVYFIQQKGFLDGDTDYLQNRLKKLKKTRGDDQFYSFYRTFLLRLFHEALGGRQRPADIEQLLGKIPYLNGGLFDVHALEAEYTDIQIPDEAFERIFKFFDQYNWHLDERPLREENEINPDVLGYIFEKYINQKQMGAYYTKEDITDYISKNTIIPFILDSAQKNCKIAFEGESSVWKLLQNDPDRYIYDAVKKGVNLELPKDIAAGIDDVSKRDTWNTPAPTEYALPTEIWREVVARRQRYEDVRAKLANGEVSNVSDLITYNLNITQFMQDVLENAEGPELVRAVWLAVAGRTPETVTNQTYQAGISVLDPTCGSGAFLFAALNILKPVYEACLERMESFITDADRSGDTNSYKDFRSILKRIDKHPNRDYFILKSIVLDNLYGVDIMEEAVEIAKLRLFLKLAAQIDPEPSKPNYGIEPLPDIDFNIRAGNTLVGYASYQEVKDAVEAKGSQGKFVFGETQDAMQRIENKATEVDRIFKLFKQQQIITADSNTKNGGAEDTAATKAMLREHLRELGDELNTHLARDYGVNVDKSTKHKKWLDSHEPFHWYTEFYGIIEGGGFDVVVGNPPYVRYSSVSETYTIKDYTTIETGDLYAFVMERSANLLDGSGYIGMIVPISVVSTDGFTKLRTYLKKRSRHIWCSNYAERPSKLFTGVEKRLTVWLSQNGDSMNDNQVSTYKRWASEERKSLFDTLKYVNSQSGIKLVGDSFPKVNSLIEQSILQKLAKDVPIASAFVDRTNHTIYYTRQLRYFIQFFDFTPAIYDGAGKALKPSELKTIGARSMKEKDALLATLNSSLFFWYFNVFSDVRNVNKRDIEAFRFDPKSASTEVVEKLGCAAQKLMKDYVDNSRETTNNYKKFGIRVMQTFQPRLSKDIIDEVDTILADHYKFTTEELDFIINYDIKYRMGDELYDD